MPTSNNLAPGASEHAPDANKAERPAPRRSKTWVLSLLAVVAVLAIWGEYLYAKRPAQTQKSAAIAAVPTAAVRTGSVERILRLTGQTSARRYSTITVTRFRGQPGMGMGGLVLTKLAPGGSKVTAGDLVAQLDTENMLTTIDDMQAGIEQTRLDNMRQDAQQTLDWQTLEQTVRSSKAAADQATLDFKAADVKTPIEQEMLRLSMEEAEARYKQQQESLPFKRISLDANTRANEIALQRQQLRYDRTMSDLKTFTFLAPMDGMVVLQSVERSGGTTAQYAVGDQVNPGRSFMKIVDTSSMQLEAQASQAETSELRVGQAAILSLDAFPGLTFKGKVYSVGAMARASMAESYFVRNVPVNIQMQGQDQRLLPDMSGAADISLGREENGLLVPLEALQQEGGRTFVYLKNGEGFEKRYVEVGLRGTTEAAIRSGLKEGDRVALSRPPAGV